MKMNVHTVGGFIKGYLGEYWIDDEYSRNGIQIEASFDVNRVAFAVDACLETIEKAGEAGAQMLVVHHGICWGDGFARIDGFNAQRIGALFKQGITLFGCHLPLDAHPVFGNNAVIAKRLGLRVNDWFYESHGLKLAAECRFDAPIDFEELTARVTETVSPNTVAFNNSKGKIETIGILSGSGEDAVHECAARGIDCLLTGEFRHAYFHYARELGVSVLSCGHYDSENTGIQELMKMVGNCCRLETIFIESPTSL